jgi:sugar phosphate isomerase/epimerase
MIRPGLVSVTFRKLTPEQIVGLVAQAGLAAIEWGGDIHAPHGDIATARAVRRLTADAGLAVAAYGSYYRIGKSEGEGLSFERVLESASDLGAPLVRVWAGDRGSQDADAAYRNMLVAESRRIVERAAQAGIAVAYEFHERTFTDTSESVRWLLQEVAHPALRTLWQPLGPDAWEPRLAGLRAVLPWLANVHAYHWPGGEQRPLAEGEDAWTHYLQALATTQRDHAVLIEFVRGDAPEAFLEDARALRRWLEPIPEAESAGRLIQQ